jgi:hypothetical protein
VDHRRRDRNRTPQNPWVGRTGSYPAGLWTDVAAHVPELTSKPYFVQASPGSAHTEQLATAHSRARALTATEGTRSAI